MHISVMKNEVLEALKVRPGGIYIDATFGQGGHSEAILEKGGLVLAIDRDQETEKYAKEIEKKFPETFIWKHDSFAFIKKIWAQNCAPCKVDGVLFDFGFSSNQIEDAQRGFSFLKNGNLDMRFDQTQEKTAKKWLNFAKKEEMAKIFFEYGQDKNARKIADLIFQYRKTKRIETTHELADLIERNFLSYGKHSATKIFQAIRIHINDEFSHMQKGLEDSQLILKNYGAIVAISFHSLEDKIIKNNFKNDCGINYFIEPSTNEVDSNKRARSAKLRCFVKKEKDD